MVIPFSETAEKSCRKKEKFNKKLRRGRVQVIECGLGSWKWEFPVLLNGITAKSPASAGKLIMVLIFCVEFWELFHLALDLSQAEKKTNIVTSLANVQKDIYTLSHKFTQFCLFMM